MATTNRKPHLLRVKQQIVALLDSEIERLKSSSGDGREVAIWIRQRNRIAKDAEVAPMEAGSKGHTGVIVY